MLFLYLCVLQVLLVQINCYSIRINCGENSNTTIKITIPLTPNGIGDIRIDGDNGCNDSSSGGTKIAGDINNDSKADVKKTAAVNSDNQGPEKIKLAFDSNNVWEAGVAQIIGADDSNFLETGDVNVIEEAPVQKEVTFEGPVRASGTVNIASQFGSILPAQPPLTRLYRPMPFLNTYPISPYDPMQPSEVLYPDDSLDTTDTSINQLLRNLFLLNVAYQSNIPCEVVPQMPANETPCESEEDEEEDEEDDEEEDEVDEVSEECDSNFFAGYLPAAGKVTIIGTSF